MQLPATFNLFDIFLRLIPGSILLPVLVYVFFPCWHYCKVSSAFLIFFYIAVSYAFGTLLYVVSKLTVTELTNRFFFGGDPRRRYCDSIRVPLIDQETVELLKKCVITGGKTDFMVMVNTLEMKGLNEKEDRMEAGASMCSSMCLVEIILAGISWWKRQTAPGIIAAAAAFGFIAGYVVYTRMRVSTVVRMYSLLMKENNE